MRGSFPGRLARGERMKLLETAFAKINLALHVRARRDDGYHEIETLFAFCEDGDVLEGETATETGLTVSGPCAGGLEADESNLVLKACHALQPSSGIRFHLVKNLPVASGIGGGSADAAAAMRLIARLGHARDEGVVSAAALRLGADVPACLPGKTARGGGVGERLELLGDELAGMPVLLVNPRVAVSTRDVFRRWDGVDRGPLPRSGSLLAQASAARNDLTEAAVSLAPAIGGVLDLLAHQANTRLVRMSGSGATCFALFDDPSACQTAADVIARSQPDWWQLSTRLR